MVLKFNETAEQGGSLDAENVRGLDGQVFWAAQVTLVVRP